jgi:hypothetical protein
MKIEMEFFWSFELEINLFQLNLELSSQFYLCVSEITIKIGIKINFFLSVKYFQKNTFISAIFYLLKEI